MYQVYCDDIIIYDDHSLDDNFKAYAPILSLSDNSAGTFSITLPIKHLYYDKINKITSTLSVYRDGKWLWEGRVVKEKIDFYDNKTIECEGALAYLNDICLEPNVLTYTTINNLIRSILNYYNSKVTDPKRKIYPGVITVKSTGDIEEVNSNYENILPFIKTNIIDVYNGHMFIERDVKNNRLVLNYYETFPNTTSQTIDFGNNLIDFARDYDFSEICTVIIPRGKQLDNESDSISVSVNNNYVNISTVNGGSIYLESNLVSKYGRFEKVVDFNDVEDPQILLKLARLYLTSYQFDDMKMVVKAADLHVLNPSIDALEFLDNVRCVSLPHGLDKYFPITAVNIPLNQPENVEYTMGGNNGGSSVSITGFTSSSENSIRSKFEKIPTRESVLKEAFRNSEAILSTKTTGYVNIVNRTDDTGYYSQALVISSSKEWETSDKYWKFDLNGLGYYTKNPVTGEIELDGIAITMDGQIVADYITAGTMDADRIRTGIIKDRDNNNLINLETGEIFLSSTNTKIIDGNNTYTVASTNDVKKINSNLTIVQQQQAVFKTAITGLQSDVYSLEANYAICRSPSINTIKDIAFNKNFTLKDGCVVVVKFIYAQTANYPKLRINNNTEYPIYVNNEQLTKNSKFNWGANQTVNFVYSATDKRWYIANGATESHIRQLADSINLSVTGALGETASITLEADGTTTKKSINLENVRRSFANDRSAITIDAGTITFNSGTFILNSDNCSIDRHGVIRSFEPISPTSRIRNVVEIDSGQLVFFSTNNPNTVSRITGSNGYLNIAAISGINFISPINVLRNNVITSVVGSKSLDVVTDVKFLPDGRTSYDFGIIEVFNGLVINLQ